MENEPYYIKELDRKQFLMRALNNGNITQEQYDEEVKVLDPIIQKITRERLDAAQEKMRSQLTTVKKTIRTDGDMKRAAARALIEFLEPQFNVDEMKGIFRQGYKITRRM